MQLPFHPSVVHLPIVITFILPFLVFLFAYMIKLNKMTPKGWLIIIGLQLAVVVSGYVSLESGEVEEDVVEKVVSKKLIHEHEEAAEVFVGSTVLSLVLSIAAFFIRKELGFIVKMVIVGVSLVSIYLAYKTGSLGGDLVYKHGAASAYTSLTPLIVPGPSERTVEENIENENESLKPDESEYDADDETDLTDENPKQED